MASRVAIAAQTILSYTAQPNELLKSCFPL
jgi:hypothetical protein